MMGMPSGAVTAPRAMPRAATTQPWAAFLVMSLLMCSPLGLDGVGGGAHGYLAAYAVADHPGEGPPGAAGQLALGCGQQKGYVEAYRGAISEVNLLKKVRLAIAVNDEFVQPTVDGIIAGARTGHIGDGKIFVLPMDQCIRIRTGETGSEAIG